MLHRLDRFGHYMWQVPLADLLRWLQMALAVVPFFTSFLKIAAQQ